MMFKKVLFGIVLVFSVMAVKAENICTPDCEIFFSFDSGGAIVANQPMVFTYAAGSEINLGETGTVNSAMQPANLDFSAGGELRLAAGESIDFDTGGFFNLVGRSNLDVDDFEVVTGDLSIFALNGQVVFGGSLNVEGALFIDSLTTDLSGAIMANELNASGVDISSLGETVELTDLSVLDGVTISANLNNGVSCLVVGNECIADNGDVYVLNNGELVKQNNGSGSFNLYFIVLLSLYFGVCFSDRYQEGNSGDRLK